MPRLIDAEKLAEYKASGFSDLTEWQQGWNDAFDTIMGETPTVDAVVVRHGHWEWDGDYICSNCGERGHRNKWNYCPNCGAKMDEVK